MKLNGKKIRFMGALLEYKGGECACSDVCAWDLLVDKIKLKN